MNALGMVQTDPLAKERAMQDQSLRNKTRCWNGAHKREDQESAISTSRSWPIWKEMRTFQLTIHLTSANELRRLPNCFAAFMK
eukprot:scaffold1294_cov78-Cylindrotheca_fusiformis.AAC.2